MVHEVDFSLYDKKQKILEETVYNLSELSKKNLFSSYTSKDSNYLSTEDEKENSENSNLTPNKFTREFTFSDSKEENDEEDEYSGLRAIKRKGTEREKTKKVLKTFKKFESFDITYSSKSKLKSILKFPSIESTKRRFNRESNKKVSFGETVYIY